jgi:hypothetical protein
MPIPAFPFVEEIAPGTPVVNPGLIVPMGIECPIEFNNLVMNDRSKLEHIRIISMDGLDDADIVDSRQQNPNDHGETAIDQPLYAGRTIVINGRIEAQTLPTMRRMKQAIRTAFNDLIEHPLIFRTGDPFKDHQIVCRKSGPIAGLETQGNNPKFTREFQLTLRASNPRWLSYLRETITVNLNETNEIKVINLGNFSSTCRVYISGPAPNISFSNLSTGQYMHINGSLLEGDIRVIDMNKLGVRITDLGGNNHYNDLEDDARRITLLPHHLVNDGNIIRMDLPASSFSANSKFSIEYYHSWI